MSLIAEISHIFFGDSYSPLESCVFENIFFVLFFVLLLYPFCAINHEMIHPIYYWELYHCRVVRLDVASQANTNLRVPLCFLTFILNLIWLPYCFHKKLQRK